jgi:hypothetical protein
MLRNKLRQNTKVFITLDQVKPSLIYYHTYKPQFQDIAFSRIASTSCIKSIHLGVWNSNFEKNHEGLCGFLPTKQG